MHQVKLRVCVWESVQGLEHMSSNELAVLASLAC